MRKFERGNLFPLVVETECEKERGRERERERERGILECRGENVVGIG